MIAHLLPMHDLFERPARPSEVRASSPAPRRTPPYSAGGSEQHEAVPDRILEAQPPPGVEDHAEAVKNAARQHEAERHRRQRLDDAVVEHDAAPAHREIEPDREPVEAAGITQLEPDADDRHAPHADQERDRKIAVLQFHDERRVGRGDQQIDRGVIEAPQHPFGARHRPEIIGRRQRQHREQARDIDRHHGDIERAGIDRGQHDQRGGCNQPESDADQMNDAVGDQLGPVVVPQRGTSRVDRGRGELLQAEDRHAGFPVGRWIWVTRVA